MISRENILKLHARQKIYNFILKNPGLHIREISRRMNIPKTTLGHHLKYLKKLKLISEKTEHGFKRIYISYEIGTKEKELLNLLREEIPRKIFLYLLFSYVFSQIELSRDLELHPATIAFYLKRLHKRGLIGHAPARNGLIYLNSTVVVIRKPKGREIFYRGRAGTGDAMLKLLITHKDSFGIQDALGIFEIPKNTSIDYCAIGVKEADHVDHGCDKMLLEFLYRLRGIPVCNGLFNGFLGIHPFRQVHISMPQGSSISVGTMENLAFQENPTPHSNVSSGSSSQGEIDQDLILVPHVMTLGKGHKINVVIYSYGYTRHFLEHPLYRDIPPGGKVLSGKGHFPIADEGRSSKADANNVFISELCIFYQVTYLFSHKLDSSVCSSFQRKMGGALVDRTSAQICNEDGELRDLKVYAYSIFDLIIELIKHGSSPSRGGFVPCLFDNSFVQEESNDTVHRGKGETRDVGYFFFGKTPLFS